MIWESHPWKRGLLSDAELVERWSAKATWSARRDELLERKIFLSAYAIRKLFEAEKLRSVLDNLTVRCHRVPKKPEVEHTSYYKIDEYYDLDHEIPGDMNIIDMCNEIIHSHIFYYLTSDESDTPCVTGFIVASDRNKRQRLVLIDMADFTRAMRTVGNDQVSYITRRRLTDGTWQSKRG